MYQPKPLLQLGASPEMKALADYLVSELRAIASESARPVDFLHLSPLHKAPTKLAEGMVVCADGTHWAPLAAGGGYFGYFGGAWVKLG